MFNDYQQAPAVERIRLNKPSRLWITLAALVTLAMCIASVNAFARRTPDQMQVCSRFYEERRRIGQEVLELTLEDFRDPILFSRKIKYMSEICQLRGTCEGLPQCCVDHGCSPLCETTGDCDRMYRTIPAWEACKATRKCVEYYGYWCDTEEDRKTHVCECKNYDKNCSR
ncbi:MAG: hypothetical protein J3R72DRAFT_445084 [Linnemannia gamsii]|nr:MAG: hypothetical protein J3R72DRAFT_445084 [Linnemannia gamsii]